MVGVAQLVRAPVCGTGGCGFKSHHSPKNFGVWRSPVSAPALGAGGREFESLHPDLRITLNNRHKALLY